MAFGIGQSERIDAARGLDMRLDLQTLRYFVSVITEGSIAAAAKKQNISPSAISKRLSDAEAMLGVTLFERTARGLEPTTPALTVLRHATRILQDVRMIEDDILDYTRGGMGNIRVASTMSAVCLHLPDALRSFSERYPRVGFQIDELNSAEIVNSVRDQKHDIGFAFHSGKDDDLEFIPFVTDQLAVVMPSDHGLATRSDLRFDEVLSYDLVGLRPGSDLSRRLETEASRLNATLRVRTRISSFDAALQLVGAGLGVSIMPLGYIGLLGQPDRFRAIVLKDDWAARQIWMTLPRRGYISEPTRLFVAATRDLAAGKEPARPSGRT